MKGVYVPYVMTRNTAASEDTHPRNRANAVANAEPENPFLKAYLKKNDDVKLSNVRASMDTLGESDLLSGVWGHMDFFRAILSELGRDPKHHHLKTAFYDFSKAVGGDGMSTGPLDKRNANTVMDNDSLNREIVAMCVPLENTLDVATFANMVETWNWAVEWGINQDGNVWVTPSKNLDYDSDMEDIRKYRL